MSEICESCGEDTPRYVMKFYSGRAHYTCHVCEHPRHSRVGQVNPFANMILEHVTGEDGKPVRVTSRRQLEAAEKKYHFRSLVAHSWEENFDKPPQLAQEHPADRIARQMAEVTSSGQRDGDGKKKGWMYPEVAAAQLRELKEKNIDIRDW